MGDPSRRTFENRVARYSCGLPAMVMVLIGIAGLISAGTLEAVIWVVAGSFLTWRAFAMTTVAVSRRGVTRSLLFRRERFRLGDIERAETVLSSPTRGHWGLSHIVLHMRDGKAVEIKQLTARGRKGHENVQTASDYVNRLIELHGSQPVVHDA